MTTGAWVLLVAVVVAVGFGLYRAATDGRFRGTHRVRGSQGAGSRYGPGGPTRPAEAAGAARPAGDDSRWLSSERSDARWLSSERSERVETEDTGSRYGPCGPTRPAEGGAAGVVAEVGGELGERATLLQFSSAFCAPCRATRRVLTEVAEVVPGVVHVEVDAEHHLEAVRRLGVARTPTTLVLDAAGREVSRAAGAPRKEQVLAALAAAQEEAR